MNIVHLAGRIGQDVEKVNDNIYKFSVATNESYKNKQGEKVEKTSWHRCIAFGNTGSNIDKFFKKGSFILLEGKIQYGEYEKDGVKQYSTDIVVNRFHFGGEKKGNDLPY